MYNTYVTAMLRKYYKIVKKNFWEIFLKIWGISERIGVCR